jgi:hypothetical protein
MPCLLKERKPGSPGIITFTHNEVLNGVAAKSEKVRRFLQEKSAAKEWIYGVHIQGDCSHLEAWPRQDWQSFLMWSDPKAPFLSSVPPNDITPITCVNFLSPPVSPPTAKTWDICIVSRPSTIKRITETLLLVQQLFELKKDLSVIFVVPDPRAQALGEKAYEVQGIDRNYFELPRKLFTCKQLKQISFISSSQRAFGTFPISDGLIADIIARSKFLLLTSYKEGVPRVIAEAFIHGTPCIVSKRLVSGLNKHLTSENSVSIDDDAATAAQQVMNALLNYSDFKVDETSMQRLFCDIHHTAIFRDFLSEKILASDAVVEGKWYLDELDLRLACHGRKHNMQFMHDERLFFDWMGKIESCTDDEPDEDYLFGNTPLVDKAKLNTADIREYIKSRMWQPTRRRLRSIFPRA